MEITKQWGQDRAVCSLGMDWFEKNKETDGIRIVEKLMLENKFRWANWVLVRLMKYIEYVSYAAYASEQVIDICEREYPNDKRPKELLDVIKLFINNPTEDNKTLIANKRVDFVAEFTSAQVIDFTAKSIIHADSSFSTSAALFAAVAYANFNYVNCCSLGNKGFKVTSHNDIFIDSPYNAIKKEMNLRILNYGLKLLKEHKAGILQKAD